MSASKVQVSKRKSKTFHPKIVQSESLLHRLENVFKLISKRAYELFEKRGRHDGHAVEDWLQAEAEFFGSFSAIEMSETDDAIILQTTVGKFLPQEIEISIIPNQVVIYGAKEHSSKEVKKSKTSYEEISNVMYHSLYLPTQVNPDQTTAELSKGILKVVMPKVTKGHQVPIETVS